MVFGVGLKLARSQTRKKGGEEDEQWYIPYNGPYQQPRETARRSKARDSWGDPLENDDDEEASVLDDRELERRYGGGYTDSSGHDNAALDFQEARKGTRDRSASLASGRSHSSAVDPSRAGTTARLRTHLPAGPRPSISTYVNMDSGGGIGESPVPQTWLKETGPSSRLSLGSMFSFGSSHKRSNSSPKSKDAVRLLTRNPRPPKLKPPKEAEKVALVLGPTSSSSSDTHTSLTSPKKTSDAAADNFEPAKADEDYYNTYYSSLEKGPIPVVSPHIPSFGLNPRPVPRPTSGSTVSQQDAYSSHSIHPYAYTFPKRNHAPPENDVPRETQRLAFAATPEQEQARPPAASGSGLGFKQLRGASSTPNLRASIKRGASVRTGGDRWLAARNWCDAILFPRPRLKVKGPDGGSFQPIISPPVTPLHDNYGAKPAGPPTAVTSRVLAHSHSLIDLRTRNLPPPAAHAPVRPITSSSDGARPKSFAMDDMAMIHPVLSLEKVVEEGQEFVSEREQWKRQAVSSLGNSRARSLSRARSKSLTQKGRGGHSHRVQESFDYLAARACLGSQSLVVTPTSPTPLSSDLLTDTSRTLSSVGRISHAHSNSLSRSKSSQNNSRGHSKNESGGGRSDIQVPSAGANMDAKLAILEQALHHDDRENHHEAKNVMLSTRDIDHGANSPTPSAVSDVRMGIAISSPPPGEEPLDREFIRMPMHPYAQAGLAVSAESKLASAINQRTNDPSDSQSVQSTSPERPFQASHPYALAHTRGSAELIAVSRSDGTVSPRQRMWAQLSPGVVREILPSDLTYSPILADEKASLPADRSSVLELGEAMANYRDSRDSGLGTSENHAFQPSIRGPSPLGLQKYVPRPRTANDAQKQTREPTQYGARPHTANDAPNKPRDPAQYTHRPQTSKDVPTQYREPVQYDASQPPYAHHRTRSADLPTSKAAPLTPLHMQKPSRPVPPQVPVSASPVTTATSGTPSPLLTHSLGSPHDLDSFQDLFYRPSHLSSAMEQDEHPYQSSACATATLTGEMLTGELALRSRRTGSGLTTLARQLSDEFEQLERERTNSQYSRSSGSVRWPPAPALARRPTDGSLRFVFEELPRSASPLEEENSDDERPIEVFKPSFKIPEDVQSNASSIVEKVLEERNLENEANKGSFRVGIVESVSTPPPETADRRHSFTGQLLEGGEHIPHHVAFSEPAPEEKHQSTLLSPATDMTRSSYMTTSTTGSRMSNLSDFPIPPLDPSVATSHMSFLSNYHNNHAPVDFSDLEPMRDSLHPMDPHDRRFTFGFDQNAADVADELSNQDH